MKLLLLFLLLTHCIKLSQQLDTVWETFHKSNSKTYFNFLNQNTFKSVHSILNDTHLNVTFFLPSESVVQDAIKNNLLSNNTTVEKVLYSILPKPYSIHDLNRERKYLQTYSVTYPTIITTPVETPPNYLDFVILSGAFNVSIYNQTQCSNGIIYHVDEFVKNPLDVLETISTLPELETLENTMKSQNLTGLISFTNKTFFAPINSAWVGEDLAFGSIIHSLKYQVINGVYYEKDLLANNYTLSTNYLSTTVKTQTFPNGSIVVVAGNSVNSDGSIDKTTTVANVIRTDILSKANSVVHLIDRVLPADSTSKLVSVQKSKSGNGMLTNITSSSSTIAVNPSNFHYFILVLFYFYDAL